MATKKDLVEAYSYSRRRLVTAFVSGAPGGREVEPAKPGRTIVGGLALGVLLVAGAAIASILAPTTPSDWKDVGLIISKEKGQPYVILESSEDPVLRPVANIISAQLILGSDVEPRSISQETIGQQRKEPAIGIIGAPDSLPGTADLVETGWTACTGSETGVAVDVSRDPGVRSATGLAVLVRTPDPVSGKDSFYVVAQAAQRTGELPRAYSYEVPSNADADKMLSLLGLDSRAGAEEVSADWLGLFPAGGGLDFASFGVDDLGGVPALRGQEGIPGDAVVGDYVVVEDSDFAFVLTSTGLAPLDPWAVNVYASSRLPGQGRTLPRAIALPDVPSGKQADLPFIGTAGSGGAHWPDDVVETLVGEQCALLETEAGEPPLVRLAQDPTPAASAAEVGPGERRVTVDPGRGAYVAAGGWDDTATLTRSVLADTGDLYPLVGAAAPTNLGYGEYDAPVVPDTWLQLLGQGVSLSVFQALCPPELPGSNKVGECASTG